MYLINLIKQFLQPKLGSYIQATASAPTFVGARAIRISNDFDISNNTETKLEFNSETYDTDSFHDNSTNPQRMTIPTGKGGKYLINVKVKYSSTSENHIYETYLVKNNTTYVAEHRQEGNTNTAFAVQITAILALSAGDYLDVRGQQNSGATRKMLFDASGATSYFELYKIAD